MSDVVEISVALLRRFAEFTKKLTPEQLHAIASGELKFVLEGARKATAKPAAFDSAAVSAHLAQMTSREEAAAHLDEMKLTLPQLRQLAKDLGVTVAGATTKVQARDRIVEHTVGYRLNSETIRRGNWS